MNGVGRWQEPLPFSFLGWYSEDTRTHGEQKLALLLDGGVSQAAMLDPVDLVIILAILCVKFIASLGRLIMP